MKRTPLIAGNWKMNKTVSQSKELAVSIFDGLKGLHDLEVEVLVCPPFTSLSKVSESLEGSGIEVGGQDCYFEEDGAFTGEVSVSMLKDIGCSFVLVGHSERRHVLGETDDNVNKKLLKALDGDLKVILCVGETEEEREAGDTLKVVESQLTKGLSGIVDADLEYIVVAYEPVWAIGTGKTATPEIAEEVQSHIRGVLVTHFGDKSESVRILYGGSVKPDNIGELIGKPSVDGALVGGASLDAENFIGIIKGAV